MLVGIKARTRAPGIAVRLWGLCRRPYMPASPRRCPALCAAGVGVGADRRYHCRACGIAVWVCGGCERGQSYCPGDCKEVRRGEQLRRAAARYQRSRRGALNHASRQRRYRQRRRRERPAPPGALRDGSSAPPRPEQPKSTGK